MGGSLDARVVALVEEYLAKGAPDREAFLAAHPDEAEALRRALKGLDFVRLAAGELAGEREEKRLGDFRLLREVGRGGMGVVYEAEQISLRRRVALKVLPFAAVLDGAQLERFRQEALAAAALHHTHIVPVHAVGAERGVHYYAMQFIDGPSLAEVIDELRRRGPRSPSTSPAVRALTPGGATESPDYCRAVARLGVEAGEALHHAHEQGIVHRDVKPANLMVDSRGHLWVTDFGLARTRGGAGLTMTGDLLGTVRYMSPEQARGEPVDHRTDVYSLGVTLYEALTLRPAIGGDDPHVVLQRVVQKEPQPLRRRNRAVPADLETVLLKAIAKEPRDRYASAEELAADLRCFLETKPVRARRPSLIARAEKWARRHRALVATAALLLLVAVAGLSVALVAIARERARTRKMYEFAHGSLDFTYGEVGKLGLPEIPGAQAARRRILEEGARYYRALLKAAEEAGEPAVSRGRIQLRLGELLNQIGEGEEARVALEEARDLLAGVDLHLQSQAVSLLGMKSLRANDLDAAERQFRQALAAFEELWHAAPDDEELRDHVANVNHMLATVAEQRGDYLEVERRTREAVRVRGKTSFTDSLNLGLALKILGRLPEAEAAYEEALTTVEAPVSREERASRGRILFNLGSLYRDIGRPEKAIESYIASAKQRAELREDFPEGEGFAEDEASSLTQLADVLVRLRRTDEAKQALDRALALSEGLSGETPALLHINLGKLYFESDPDRAAEEFHKAAAFLEPIADVRPERLDQLASCFSNLGLIENRRQRHEEAQAAFDRALQSQERLVRLVPAAPGFRETLGAIHNNRAADLDAWGKKEAAIEAFARARDVYAQLAKDVPAQPRYLWLEGTTLLNIGLTYKELGQSEPATTALREAADTLQQAAERVPEMAEYREDLFRTLLNLRDVLRPSGKPRLEPWRQAVDVAETLRRDFPESERYLQWAAEQGCGLGRALEPHDAEGASGAYDRALKAEEELSKRDPNRRGNLAVMYQRIGVFHMLQANFDASAEALHRATAIGEEIVANDPRAASPLASAYQTLVFVEGYAGRPDDAIAPARSLLEMRRRSGKDVGQGYSLLVDALCAANRYTEAAQVCREWMEKVGGRDARNGLAWALAQGGQSQEAVALARQLTEEEPKDGKAWRVLGATLLRSGKPKGALEALEKAMDVKSEDIPTEALFLLAMTHAQLGNAKEARACFERGSKLLDTLRPHAHSSDGFIMSMVAEPTRLQGEARQLLASGG